MRRGPRIVLYRDYSKFDKNNFRQALKDCLHEVTREDVGFSEFNDRVETVLDEHAPIKKKYGCANDGPFMTKVPRKAIYTRTNLRNIYNNNKSQENWNAFKKKRNRCVKMLRQAKIDYYKTLNIKYLADNRNFWKTVKPLFSDKIQAPSKIALLENEVLVTDDKEVAEIFNEYFVNKADSLGIIQPKDALQDIDGISDPVDIAIQKYSSRPSVKLISSNTKPSHSFALILSQIAEYSRNYVI